MTMTEAEKKALSKMNQRLNEYSSGLWGHMFGEAPPAGKTRTLMPFKDPDGDTVVLELKRGQRAYRYYEDGDKNQYCYTPWKDTKGWYWCFDYRAIYDRKTKQIDHFKLEKPVRFRQRKLATQRAEKRLESV